ncbi:HlyD family efflux transporter periplasmic adaptor subunit [Planctomycetes bacterium K23_9]|uniref:Uncharacterized protein n=1 Tax=Stieleria marina TaxID=1930275 RepID=A0A517NZV0_9BACT|nr:hypothetical protein K239x_46430 [Planctomycetes bacterium K23_9]
MSDPIRMADHIWSNGESLLNRLESLSRENVMSNDFYESIVDGLAGATQASHVRLWAEAEQTELWTFVSPRTNSGTFSLTPTLLADRSSSVWTEPTTLRIAEQLPQYAQCVPPVVMGLLVCMPSAPSANQASAIGELAEAVMTTATRQYLKDELYRVGEQIDQQDTRARWIEQLCSGITLQESLAGIASALSQMSDVDRVSLLKAERAGFRLIATSTQSNVDRRAQQVRLLESLVDEVIPVGGMFEFVAQASGEIDRCQSETLQSYLLSSGAKAIRIESVPIGDSVQQPIAGIVVESFRDAALPAELENRSMIDRAVRRAVDRDRIGLSQLTMKSFANAIGKLSASRRCWAALAVAASVIAVLWFVPAPFDIPAKGTLVAAKTQRLFAPSDAIAEGVLVRSGQNVKAGDALVRLRSAKLELLNEQIKGDLATARTELAVAKTMRSNTDSSGKASTSTAGTQQLLQTRIDGLIQQLNIVQQQRDDLTIRSPIDGQVDRWDLDQALHHRPVVHGEYLLSVVAPSEGWEVQLDIAESDSGYVIESHRESPAKCSFRLTSRTEANFDGTLSKLSDTAIIADDGRPVLRGEIEVTDSPETDDFRVGATVNASIHCGRRSVGFVWFRSFIQWARGQSWW